jgi:hypothetical protein
MKHRFHKIVTTIFCALFSVGSGTAFASDTKLDFILHDAAAFVTSVPRLAISEDNATLSYIGDLNCNTTSNLQNCQSYNLVCNFDTPHTIQLDFIGLGVSYVPFARMIKSSNRFPYIIYTDPIIRRYNRKAKREYDYDRQKIAVKSEFQFTSAERLGEFDAGTYSIHWETGSEEVAVQLLEMLSSGDLLLLAIPESSNTQTFYNKLPPSLEGDEADMASQFATTCTSNWEERQ